MRENMEGSGEVREGKSDHKCWREEKNHHVVCGQCGPQRRLVSPSNKLLCSVIGWEQPWEVDLRIKNDVLERAAAGWDLCSVSFTPKGELSWPLQIVSSTIYLFEF